MHRISTSTKAANLFGSGKHGFKNGDLSSGDAPTSLNDSWFNDVQEELMNLIEAAGLSESESDRTQVLQTIRAMTGGAGRVQAFARSTAPTGWLKCNGAAVSRTTYAALFAAIGTTHGAGDGSTTFNVPDLRGEFLRGWDDGRGLDAARAFGTVQSGQNAAHAHGVNDAGHSHTVSDPGHAHGIADPGHSHGVADPGHNHTWGGNEVGIDPATGAGYQSSDGLNNYGHLSYTSASGTGIGIAAATTGVGVYGAGTNVGVNGAASGVSIQSSGGAEARPRNVALLYCISVF